MASNENYQSPIDVDAEPMDPELIDAQQAWIEGELDTEPTALPTSELSDAANELAEDATELATELSSPFVGRWNQLISQTNWEKGRIIHQWRQALIESGAPASEYSDDAWAKQVGGVTAPHVGRLRRVFDQFGDTYESYSKLSWTHFLAAMDWEDAPLWLQGASDGGWSVSGMRKQRWETLGGSPDEDPSNATLVASDLDEDFDATATAPAAAAPGMTQPAQGGGSGKQYDDEPSGISAGPVSEGPDFGDEESLNAFPTATVVAPADGDDEGNSPGVLVQPFAGLPALPDDLSDAVELLKLAIVRHKATGWQSVELDTVRSYLSAFLVLIDARSK